MGLWEGVLSAEAGGGAVNLMRTRIRLLAQPISDASSPLQGSTQHTNSRWL